MSRTFARILGASVWAFVWLAGCSPSLDWREIRPEGDTLVLLFPCRPELRQRSVRVADAERVMRQLSCDAAGAHFSLAMVEAERADAVEPLLAALKVALSGNLGAAAPTSAPSAFVPSGATPNAASTRTSLAGHRPDGTALHAESGVFVHGLRVYQATLLSDAPAGESAAAFLSAIRFAAATPAPLSPPR